MSNAFIESSAFPIDIINRASVKEKGPARPPYWEMVFWWTRKPLAGARAIIAGALLPENIDVHGFLKWIYPRYSGKDFAKTPHFDNPQLPNDIKEKFKQIRLLDPFAGFGSIPLEVIRLGVGEVVAVEFLPTAYVFLKAVLEYPKKYSGLKIRIPGREVKELGLEDVVKELTKAEKIVNEGVYEIPSLIYDVAKRDRWVTEKLREDPDIKELYDDDVAVYIGTWEVKCPNTLCNRYTPLVGNWWLARVEGKKYAYMKPKVEGDKVNIEVVEGKSKGAPSPNIRGKPELAECLLCGSRITYIDLETGRAYGSRGEAGSKQVRGRLEFYPKHAVRDWNQKLEQYLEGRIVLEELKNALARPRLLVKVRIVGRDLKFEPCSEEDNEKLWKVVEKLKRMWGDPDIPKEPIPEYENRRITPILGATYWYQFFNPRQLLTLVKLVKLIREVGKRVEEEKLREGWSKEEAFRYAEAVTTYLAIALNKFADYNSMMSGWQLSYLIAAHTLAMRGIAMVWNWGEYNPYSEYSGTFATIVERNILHSLSYLVSAVSGSPSRVRVLLDDATTLSRLRDERFDVIVTDPPYRDDVPYAELSDFYYVWLKRALSDVGNGRLAPRFHDDAFFKEGKEIKTQWQSFAPQEVSYNEGRIRYFRIRSPVDYYQWLLSRAFKKIASIVKDDGLIVTYFAHSSPEAWTELIEAGWGKTGLKITRAWGIVTESVQRVTAREKVALESSIVVVWRKGDEGKTASVEEVREKARQKAREALEVAEKKVKLRGLDLFLAVMTACLSEFTSYDKIARFGGELMSEDVVRESYRVAIEVLVGDESKYIRSPEALAYITTRRLFARLPEWDWVLDSQDLITLGYGLYSSFEGGGKERLYELLLKNRIVKPPEEIKEEGRKGSKVAKPKDFIFLSPQDKLTNSIKEVLSLRSLDPMELGVLEAGKVKPLTTSIDVLHLLEYAAHQTSEYFKEMYSKLVVKYPALTEEAINVAKALSKIEDDPEGILCRKIIKNIYEVG